MVKKKQEVPVNLREHVFKHKGKYVVVSKDGSKRLGTYKTRGEALKRLRQVEYFKNEGK